MVCNVGCVRSEELVCGVLRCSTIWPSVLALIQQRSINSTGSVFEHMQCTEVY
jgi:hypothetical protein